MSAPHFLIKDRKGPPRGRTRHVAPRASREPLAEIETQPYEHAAHEPAVDRLVAEVESRGAGFDITLLPASQSWCGRGNQRLRSPPRATDRPTPVIGVGASPRGAREPQQKCRL